MVGISKAARLERAHAEAVTRIREVLPQLAEQLVEAALGRKKPVSCPKCKHKFEVTVPSDPKLALELWARAEGKPTEQPKSSELEPVINLLKELNALRESPEPLALATVVVEETCP